MVSTWTGFKAAAVAVAMWMPTGGCGQNVRGAAKAATAAELQKALRRELYLAPEVGGEPSRRVDEFAAELNDTYTALPKNKNGMLDHQTVRYILHRLFVQRHGWYMQGLEPNGDTWHANSEGSQIDWAPSYLLTEMEKLMEKGGVHLHELGSLAAAFEDLVNQEVIGTIQHVYETLGWSTDRDLTHIEVHEVIDDYMAFFLGDKKLNLTVGIVSDLAQKEGSKSAALGLESTWSKTQAWFRGIEQTYLTSAGTDGSQSDTVGFEQVVEIAQAIGAQYGSFKHSECWKMKGAMHDVWSKGKSTGRIRLVDFYRMGLETEWNLTEKLEYLRRIGAIDESTAGSPMVMIPNYLAASPNCVHATNLYSVCCRNDCEDLMLSLERDLSAPSASAERIAELVQSYGTQTKRAHWTLQDDLRQRLDDMATLHGGDVRIHGRLFAQFMHHAFPGECPFPHEAGSSDPITPDEWMGLDTEASEEERMQHLNEDTCGPEQAAAEWNAELPWSHTEELLSREAGVGVRSDIVPSQSGVACGLVYLLVLVGLAAAVVASVGLKPGHDKLKLAMLAQFDPRVAVLGLIMLVLVVTNMVDRLLVALIMVAGLAVRLLTRRSLGTQSALAKACEKEKCLV